MVGDLRRPLMASSAILDYRMFVRVLTAAIWATLVASDEHFLLVAI